MTQQRLTVDCEGKATVSNPNCRNARGAGTGNGQARHTIGSENGTAVAYVVSGSSSVTQRETSERRSSTPVAEKGNGNSQSLRGDIGSVGAGESLEDTCERVMEVSKSSKFAFEASPKLATVAEGGAKACRRSLSGGMKANSPQGIPIKNSPTRRTSMRPLERTGTRMVRIMTQRAAL